METVYGSTVFDASRDRSWIHLSGRFEGLLLGMAVAEALALRYRGQVSGSTVSTDIPSVGWLLCGVGTQQSCLIAQALLMEDQDVAVFAKRWANRVRCWLLSAPVGIDGVTARAGLRLLLGVSPRHSGRAGKGLGAWVRAPLVGAYFAGQFNLLQEMTAAAVGLTHDDAVLEQGAWLIAVAAAFAMRFGERTLCARSFFDTVLPLLDDTPFGSALSQAKAHIIDVVMSDAGPRMSEAVADDSSAYWVAEIITVWLLNFGNYQATLADAFDRHRENPAFTAIVGALAGMTCGRAGIPQGWLASLIDWPMSVRWISRLANQLESKNLGGAARRPRLFWPALLLRNLIDACWRAMRRLTRGRRKR